MGIPERPLSDWDGGYKYKTKNCEGCEFYREINNKELCGWGVAFKYLDKSKKFRKCGIKNKKPPKNNSIKYLDDVIEDLKIKNGNSN